MATDSEMRMKVNLMKGVAWLAVGAVAIALVEVAWHAWAGGYATAVRDAEGGFAGDDADAGGFGYEDLASYALGDDIAVLGRSGAPFGFAQEYFDPSGLGEVSRSADGNVVGVVSDMDSGALFAECADGLAENGWVKATGGQDLRCTFRRAGGGPRWLYLGVTEVPDGAAAVMVLEARR